LADFFKDGFGKILKSVSRKTKQKVQGQAVYRANKAAGPYIKEGDLFYLDNRHKDHLEVFHSNRKFKLALNLDGSFNAKKTLTGLKKGRKLRK